MKECYDVLQNFVVNAEKRRADRASHEKELTDLYKKDVNSAIKFRQDCLRALLGDMQSNPHTICGETICLFDFNRTKFYKAVGVSSFKDMAERKKYAPPVGGDLAQRYWEDVGGAHIIPGMVPTSTAH